eukprot:350342-Chlamydomonas_euryale.AAC.1
MTSLKCEKRAYCRWSYSNVRLVLVFQPPNTMHVPPGGRYTQSVDIPPCGVIRTDVAATYSICRSIGKSLDRSHSRTRAPGKRSASTSRTSP